MNKDELEAGLAELDAALVKAFPGNAPIECMVVGGAALIFEGVIDRVTEDIDVVIFNLLDDPNETTLVFSTPLTDKIRRIVKRIGRKRFQLKGEHAFWWNDNCAPFLLELSRNELPPLRLYRKYTKLHLYLPNDLRYIFALKLLSGRANRDFDDIRKLCDIFDVRTRAQAQAIVNRYFPSPLDHFHHGLPGTLRDLFKE